MNKKLISCILAAACAFTLMGCDADVPEGIKEKVGGNGKGTIECTVVDHPVECVQDEKVLATGSYPEIILSDESADSFQNLKRALDKYNEDYKNTNENLTAEYGSYVLTDEEGSTGMGEALSSIEVVRADSKLFTILDNISLDWNGGNPSKYTTTTNIDVTTGHVMNLAEVVNDSDKVAEMIREKTFEKYPENKKEIETYNACYCATDEDPFKLKMDDDSYSWTLTDEGLHIYFSAYEMAGDEIGPMDVVIPQEDISNYIQDAYKIDEAYDISSQVSYKSGDIIEVTPAENSDDYYDYDDSYSAVSVSNPTWHRYVSDKAKPASTTHISLTETSKDTTDWLDTTVWAEKNGFESPFLSYGDGNYYYAPGEGGEWGYEFTTLFLYDYETNDLIRTYDLDTLCNGPDNEEDDYSFTRQYIHWAKAEDGVLYVSLGHNGYASEEPWSSYMVAIDMKTDTVLWRSEPQVSNAANFQIVDDTIICGYGFTEEPDYLYLLDKNTGEKVDQIKLVTGPSQIEVVGDTLYVATYNTAYTFKINK